MTIEKSKRQNPGGKLRKNSNKCCCKKSPDRKPRVVSPKACPDTTRNKPPKRAANSQIRDWVALVRSITILVGILLDWIRESDSNRHLVYAVLIAAVTITALINVPGLLHLL